MMFTTASANSEFHRHLNGLLLLGLTLFVRANKKYIPQVKAAGIVVSEVKREE